MRLLLLPLLGLFLSYGAEARANAFDIYGGDVEAQSMGDAFTALADRSTGAYYNPGALGMMVEEEVRISGFTQTSDLRFNGREMDIHPTRGYFLSAGTPFALGGQRFGFGFASFIPSDTVLNLVSRDPSDPHFPFYDHYPNRLALYFGLGWEMLGGALSVGAGFQGFIDISGEIQANIAFINQSDQDDYLSASACEANANPECDLRPGETPDRLRPSLFFNQSQKVTATPTLGALLTPTPNVRIGFSWRDSFHVGLSMPQDSNTQVPFAGGLRLATTIRMDSFYQPATWSLGAAYSPDFSPNAETYTLSMDLRYREFRRYRSHELLFKVTNVDELEATTPFTVIETNRVDPDFRDTQEIRIGWRHRIGPAFRYSAGWAWVPSPIPAQTGSSNYLDSDKQTISAGLGWNLGWMGGTMDRVDFLLAGQLHLLERRRFTKRDPRDNIGREIGFLPGTNPMLAGPEDVAVLDAGLPNGRLSGWAGAISAGLRLGLH